jgi:hypothetical protein
VEEGKVEKEKEEEKRFNNSYKYIYIKSYLNVSRNLFLSFLKKGSGEDQLTTIQGTGKRKIKRKKTTNSHQKKKGKK